MSLHLENMLVSLNILIYIFIIYIHTRIHGYLDAALATEADYRDASALLERSRCDRKLIKNN